MSVVLENNYLRVGINEKGAELRSVESIKTNLQYMWSGDPAFWGKISPILFPIVGTLRDDTFFYRGRSYSLTRHGFARDMIFEVKDQKDEEASFLLSSNEALREKFPFDFKLEVKYSIDGDQLIVGYHVQTTDDEPLYFSIGAHPAFKVPLVDRSAFEDHYLEFEVVENAERWPINDHGLIKNQSIPFLSKALTIRLRHELFAEDALVFKDIQSKKIYLRSEKHDHGLEFSFEGFPFLGIWSAPNADFVCIEPWCGIADSESHNQQLVNKEGIIKLFRGSVWTRTWKVRFY